MIVLLLACAVGAHAQSSWNPAWSMPDLKFHKAAPFAQPVFDPDAPPEVDPPPTGDDEQSRPREFATEPLAYHGVRLLASKDYPAFSDDLDAASLAAAARQSDRYWAVLGDLTPVTIAGKRYMVGQLRASARELVRLAALGPAVLQAQVPARFDVFESVSDEVVFTAYYEPEIEAAAAPDAAHPMPILGRPAELREEGGGDSSCLFLVRKRGRARLRSTSCWTRAQIDRGALAGRGLELAWAGPADLFDLQLEGSGWIVVAGRRRRLAYDSTNGRPFRSAERALMNSGGLPEGADFFGFIRGQPLKRQLDILEVNPRYTFFHEASPDEPAPTGALGTALTAKRSLAVSRQMPRGLPAFFSVGSIQRFAFAQDAGKAISDPGRVDVFWGSGPQAGAEARRFKAPGRLFFLVLKNPPAN